MTTNEVGGASGAVKAPRTVSSILGVPDEYFVLYFRLGFGDWYDRGGLPGETLTNLRRRAKRYTRCEAEERLAFLATEDLLYAKGRILPVPSTGDE